MKIFEIILPFFLLIFTNCETCRSGLSITDTECFNEIIYLDIENKYYRAGHFSMNSKGDLIIEYSYLQYRLFFGLKKNGKFYFPEMVKEIELQSDTIDSEVIRRYESTNSFVSLMTDTNKQKEYLFSISSWKTVLELYNLENENDSYDMLESTYFTNLDTGIHSYIFQILEKKINGNNTYFCIYVSDSSEGFFIRKFGFSSFNFRTIQELRTTNLNDINFKRIISSIIIDYYDLIGIFYICNNNYFFSLYNLNIYSLRRSILIRLDSVSISDGIFFKAVYLYDQYFAFLYFDATDNIGLKIYYINEYHVENIKKEINFVNKNLLPIVTMNEFLKIDNKKLVFISIIRDSSAIIHTTSSYENSNKELFILFFDFYGDYEYIQTRYYQYTFQNSKISKFTNEISAFIFNGFLAFTGTVLPIDINSDKSNVFAIFLMFSYPNGTDFEINIFPYLTDTGSYDNSYNLYNYLMSTMRIDNNIFGYEKIEQIKLVSIPDEIIFLNGTDNSIISNGSNIDINYLLKQNMNIIKENNYYYLDYQFVVKEPDYEIFYSNTYGEVEGDTQDLRDLFTPKILYGRTNTLKFKLCHEFCQTCFQMSNNNNDQKCESCLEQYSFNNNPNTESECVEEGYYYDAENRMISSCTPDNSKFYVDITTNKKICFKDELDCPIGYSYYNETSKECKYLMVLNDEIRQMIDNELIKNYTQEDDSIEIKGENNSIFQLTTTNNELDRYDGKKSNNNNLSIIDLGSCETTLKSFYKIEPNLSLLIKKFEVITISSERNVQYEVYHPLTKEKLNLSLCNSSTIDLYIPITLDQKIIDLYDDLQKNGYDLFDINDPFYNDICSPYKSENNTDVLLSDRKNDYYNNDNTTCQSNCEYSQFISEYKFLKCECKIIVDNIDIHDFHKFSKKISKNFYDILRNSNIKTLKCYNIVFNLNYLKKNIGNFIDLALFVGYFCFFIIFIIKGISP